MKKEYLWDKTGSDPEIEKLENVLKTFRAAESDPPKLPGSIPAVDVTPADETRSWRLFSFGMVSFAALAFTVFGLGMFLFLGKENDSTAEIEPKQNGTEVVRMNPVENVVEETVVLPEPVGPRKQTGTVSRSKPAKVVLRKVKPRIRRFHRAARTTKKAEPKPQKVVLTKEEKHAYDQLMLALNITSSNLKLVRDKVQGDD